MAAPHRFFDRHLDYSQLLSGAHRKPATSIGTPALVCHLAFWQPDDAVDEKLKKTGVHKKWDDSDAKNWITNIDEYLRYLYCLLLDYEVSSPNTDASKFDKSNFLFLLSRAIDLKSATRELVNVDQLNQRKPGIDGYFDKSYRSIIFEFVWHHLPVKLRVEKHKEYLQITSIIDLSEAASQVGELSLRETFMQDTIYREIYRQLSRLDKLLFNRKNNLANPQYAYRKVETVADEREEFRGIHTYLYQEIWMRFVSEILNSDRAIHGTGHAIDIPGSVSEQYKARSERSKLGGIFADFRGLVFNERHPDEKIATGDFLQLPGWHVSELRSTAVPLREISSDDGAQLTYSLWPLLTIEDKVDLKKYEFTVSRMLGSRALYITALGAQPSPYLDSSLDSGDDRQLPVFYLAYFTTFNRWQIGRLIDRINHLGTVRIAAIQQSEKLREKGTELQSLSVDEVLGSSTSAAEQQALLDKMIFAQGRIADWAKQDFPGGIHYRIERSGYYVKQFRDGVPALRIKRVGGYQPYDVFVEHRLGAVFDFIRTLGVRLERFERRFNVLYQFLLVGKSVEQTRTIARLQTAAEAFFLGLAAPYYLLGAAHYVMPREALDSRLGTIAEALLWVAFLCLGMSRFIAYRKMREET